MIQFDDNLIQFSVYERPHGDAELATLIIGRFRTARPDQRFPYRDWLRLMYHFQSRCVVHYSHGVLLSIRILGYGRRIAGW